MDKAKYFMKEVNYFMKEIGATLTVEYSTKGISKKPSKSLCYEGLQQLL